MRRYVILCCDIVLSIVLFGWSRLGPWDSLLGFSVYHSRGNVWLPTPPAAANYFRDIVSTGSLVFAASFLVTSFLMFCLGRSSTDEKQGNIFYRAFYGDTRELVVKYSATLFISFISPFFYRYMLRFPVTPQFRIAGGLAISIAAFILIVVLTELAARIAPQRRPLPNF